MSVVVSANMSSPTMETCADKVNPLVLGGTSQLDRYLAQLDPAYIAVNEKTREQWLTFTANMAECLNYYNIQNTLDGNWSAFFNQSLVSYARLSLQDTSAIQTYFSDLLAILQSSDEQAYTPRQRCDAFTTICYSIFTLCTFIDGQLTSPTSDSDYNNRLTDLVANKLKQPLAKLITYVLAADELHLSGGLSTLVPPIQLFGAQVPVSVTISNVELNSSSWFSPSPDFATYVAGLNADVSIFSNAVNPQPLQTSDPHYNELVWRSFLRASSHNLFTSVINTFIYACTYIQQLNAQAFTTALGTGQFPPHLSLYFSFLTMLEQAQNDLNKFTERHLNFFYESVLRLGPLPAQPNQAHVTLQLSKTTPEYLIPGGTLFSAGKDDKGVNVSYALVKDTVFNQATIASLKSFYIAGQLGETDNNTTTNIKNNGKAFASPVADSADGIGESITTTPAAWHPFGNKSVSNTGDVTMLMPLANVGFAIASQYLYLQEGKRVIQIQLFTSNISPFQQMPTARPPFSCQLTTPGTSTGWTTVDPTDVTLSCNTVSPSSVTLTVTLDPKFPAVGGYSTKLNGPSIQTDLPLIQFSLVDTNFGTTGYFQNIQFTSFTKCVITVTVGTNVNGNSNITPSAFNGLKTLYLSNDGGAIDPSQPFSPFGTPAVANTAMNVGCRELFLKPGATYSLLVEHTDIPDYSNPPTTSSGYTLWYYGAGLWFINSPYPEFWNIDFSNCNSWGCIIQDVVNVINTYQDAVNAAAPQLTTAYLEGGVWVNNPHPYSYPISNPPAYITPPTTRANPLGVLASGTIPVVNSNASPIIDYEDIYTPYSQASTAGFLRVLLNNDFGYDLYNVAMIQYRMDQSMAAARAIATTTAVSTYATTVTTNTTPGTDNFRAYQPLVPYAPTIKNISLNYTASVTLDITSSPTNPSNPYVHYYYIYPFGAVELTWPVSVLSAIKGQGNLQLPNVSELQPLTATQGATVQVPVGEITWSSSGSPSPASPNLWPPYIFPPFNGIVNGGTISFNSEFYIGLSSLKPGENVNLLFQVLDGSTNPLLVSPPKNQQIFWFCLCDNQWVALTEMVTDNTNQLTESGIITFQIPEGATSQNTLLPAGYIWLKAGLTGYPDTVCKLIKVLPQAALLQFADKGNSPDFLQKQIPAGSISKLVKPLAPVKQIVQPFQSFGGRTAESQPAFRVRVSERLRHKDRAIQIWDYEHLILQQFTTIQKVKCLNHTEYNPSMDDGILYSEQAPGHVTIVTIPYVNQSNSANVLKPYTNVSTLNAIENFISSRISAQVALHVYNPVFEEIALDFQVKFMPGVDVSYYTDQLNQAIVKYLSPWAFVDEADISFGGEIYKSTLVNFIEGQPYVNYITNVHMRSRASSSIQYSADKDTVVASNGISILVSAPVHAIIPLT